MLNKCCFIGNVGKDPEIRSTQSGKEIANLSLGVTDRWKDHATGEKKEQTEWVRVVVFNEGLVGVIKQYVKKGARLYIEGKMQTRKWTDQQGIDKYSTEIVLAAFGGILVMLGSPGDGRPAQQEAQSQPSAKSPPSAMIDDEIPF